MHLLSVKLKQLFNEKGSSKEFLVHFYLMNVKI